MTQVAVMGSGSWGTAFASIVAQAGATVTLWSRRDEVAREISSEHRNSGYLPDLVLPESISATTDPAQAADGADLVVLAVPSQSLRENLSAWGPIVPDRAAVVSLMKGIELGTALRMSQVITEVTDLDPHRIAVVSGPNLAREIAERQPAAAVVASSSARTRARVAEACATGSFRPYTASDVVGVEVAGAMKNVIALAVGMAKGRGLGENTMASLLTRGLAETARFGVRLGADPQTFLGLAGVGDLVATCTSPLSRNYHFGYRLGQGHSLEQVQAETTQTAEGVKSCRSILQLAASVGSEVPIVENVAAVLFEGRQITDVMEQLMSRSRKPERS